MFLSDLVQLMVDRPRTTHLDANLRDVLEWLPMLDTGDAAAIDRGSEGRESARTQNPSSCVLPKLQKLPKPKLFLSLIVLKQAPVAHGALNTD